MESGLLQPVQHVIARLLSAELTGECPSVEEWPQTPGDGAFAVRILLSAHFGIRGGKHRMRDQLVAAPWTAGQGAIAYINALSVTVKQIVGHAEPCCRETICLIETERTLQPRQ
jgi:hypothetical protein